MRGGNSAPLNSGECGAVEGMCEEDAQSRFFARLLRRHDGNVCGRGFGKPDVGVTVQQRVSEPTSSATKTSGTTRLPLYPDAIAWPQVGLPQDYFPLIAPYGSCFMPEGKEAVSHGGIALEEVMVPFVRITEGR